MTEHRKTTWSRARIENLWDRATPVGPLLDSYRAENLHEAADEVLREVTTCNAGPDCGPCTTRRSIAARLRQMAKEVQP